MCDEINCEDTKLSLKNRKLNDNDLKKIIDSCLSREYCPQILNVSWNHLTDKVLVMLTDLIVNPQLKYLVIFGNQIGIDSILDLEKSLDQGPCEHCDQKADISKFIKKIIWLPKKMVKPPYEELQSRISSQYSKSIVNSHIKYYMQKF